ncbi:MAG TPA: hypothetical protein VMC85_05380 [Desulfomonilaceae bacterium]|nr:hypothetical protein [Desulfomonilaceae bacterium]
MQLISVDIAKAIWLFPLTEMNPTGRSLTQIFADIRKRYSFQKAPSHSLDYDSETKGLIFSEGEFINQKGEPILVKLSLFSDGAVAETWSSTTDSEGFLRDVMGWIHSEHGISLPPDRTPRIFYLSHLTVSMSHKHGAVFSKLQQLSELLGQKLTASGRSNKGFVAGGFSLWAANWDENVAPAAYRFEIKAGSKPGENRYFSAAPLPTEAHMEMLKEQEQLLA